MTNIQGRDRNKEITVTPAGVLDDVIVKLDSVLLSL